jgi:hypothetical protein
MHLTFTIFLISALSDFTALARIGGCSRKARKRPMMVGMPFLGFVPNLLALAF